MLIVFLMCFHLPLLYTSPIGNNVCKTFDDYATIKNNKNCYYNSDVDLTPSQIVKKYGFPFETYNVKTEDGYILSLFRIPHDGTDKPSRQPVVLQHGLMASSAAWLLLGENSLAFFLAKNGYDIWLPNFRGSTYSMGQENSEITEREYWNFSFHEMGVYDLPAYIAFISNMTGKNNKDIIYVGHSMGTTVAFIYASSKKDHAEKYLNKIVALSPVAYLKHLHGLIPALVQYADILKATLEDLGFFGILQFTDLQKFLAKMTCNTYPLIIFCQIFLSSVTGLVLEQIKPEGLPLMSSYLPAGTAIKTLYHYAQIISANGRFQVYDYGGPENMGRYNSSVPPEYPVEKISIPTHLFVGTNDSIADYEDVLFLYNKLKCNKSWHSFEMAHNDFLFGKNINSFYKTLLKVMKI